MSKVWSSLQEAIFNKIERGEGNVFVNAVAGSGKTTTIVEATNRCGNRTRIFLAFNKAIADELRARGVFAKTFHALCITPVSRFKGAKDVDTRKMVRLTKAMGVPYHYGSFVRKLVGLGKQAGVGCPGMATNEKRTWMRIISHHNLELDSEFATIEQAVAYAEDLLDESNRDPGYDFDDMLYLVVKENLQLDKFDFIFVDEAQDTNALQREILRKMMHDGTRLVAVGDPAQSIYGFRGADSTAIEVLCEEFECETLPLSVTYRCDRAIVQYAQQWVPDIQAREGAEQGVVKSLDSWDLDMFESTDLILCRTSKGLLSLGLRMIKNQIPVQILGKEIGEGLRSLIKRMDTQDLDILSQRLVEWRDREMTKSLKDEDENAAQNIQDKADAILAMIDGMPEGQRTMVHLNSAIDYMFDPKQTAVRLATIHKAKGLEAPRVFWLNRKMCPSKWAKSTWQKQQELNLCYVATTRAKHELYMIEDGSAERGARRSVAEA